MHISEIYKLNELFVSVGWNPRPENLWEVMFSMAEYLDYVREDDKIVSFGRLVNVTPSSSLIPFYTIYDLAVNPYYNRRGFGKKIVSGFISKLDKQKDYVLYAEALPSSISFFDKLGFQRIHDGVIEGRIISEYRNSFISLS